jgi:phosphoribosylaminoimidazolecarboxamide formyltransferase / IMP cyclohydrolase
LDKNIKTEQHPVHVQGLSERGYEILSTGGTAKALVDANISVVPIQDVTNFPEMLGGRVKTLHPAVHGGILARRDNSQDTEEMKKAGLSYIDVVVVNLYPFRATVTSEPPPDFAAGVEQIDIGGPAMLRAAAKNHAHVAVVVDPADYNALLEHLDKDSPEFRRTCAWKAFQVDFPSSLTSCTSLHTSTTVISAFPHSCSNYGMCACQSAGCSLHA